MSPSSQNDLTANKSKCFSMVIRRRSKNGTTVSPTLGGTPWNQIAEFQYLWLVLNNKQNLSKTASYVTLQAQAKLQISFQFLINLAPNYPFRTAEKICSATVLGTADFGAEIHRANPSVDSVHLTFLRRCSYLRRITRTNFLHNIFLFFSLHFRHISALEFPPRSRLLPGLAHYWLLCKKAESFMVYACSVIAKQKYSNQFWGFYRSKWWLYCRGYN